MPRRLYAAVAALAAVIAGTSPLTAHAGAAVIGGTARTGRAAPRPASADAGYEPYGGAPTAASTGRTVSYNEGGAGECTWWAIEKFRAYSGLYPDLNDPANNGNAGYWAANAAANGWTVTSRPAADSIAVFPPGVNGAQAEGHAAWVTRASGTQITISEMNGPAGWDVVDTRTLVPASSVRYILTPG